MRGTLGERALYGKRSGVFDAREPAIVIAQHAKPTLTASYYAYHSARRDREQ
jgi:hypothetical protein